MQFDGAGPLKHNTVVTIPRGEGVNAIASRLEREGIIHDRRIFMAAVLYFGAQAKLKAGDYAIESGATMRSVLDTLIEGDAILYSVTIPEGWTSLQVVERLRATRRTQRRNREHPAGRVVAARHLPLCAQHAAQRYHRADAGGANEFLNKVWPRATRILPISTGGSADPRLDRGKGNRPCR